MDSVVVGQLGMERRRQDAALAHHHRVPVRLGENFDPGAGLGHPRGPDVHRPQRTAGQSVDREVLLERCHLPAERVAFHDDVECRQLRLIEPGRIGGEKDHPGAGAQHGQAVPDRRPQRSDEALITGEAGSGRETFARYLHTNSRRRDRRFVDVAVSGIEPGNAARELFGTEEDGRIQYGRLEQASGGVLFLDEVVDMDLDVQGRLVGALDTGSFLRVGGVEPVQIDVRIIAATRHNLEERVQEGSFREDLFFHLNVVPLHVIPLREHAEDIPDLLNYYLDYFSRYERLTYREIGFAAQNYLRSYHWPGNVLELKNVVQRLLILGGGGEISLEEVRAAMGAASSAGGNEGVAISFDQPLRQAREEFEKAYLQYQFEKHDGNVTKMAQEVGMERTHLYRKLRSVGVEVRERR